jgi:Transglycosylase
LKTLLRTTFAIISLGVGLTALFLLVYELWDFRPYFNKIQGIYVSMDREDREPPEKVQEFVWKVDGKNIDTFAAQQLLGDVRGSMRASAWHYHSFLWTVLLRWHFSKAQRLAFYCHYLPYEAGNGFERASEFYFQKQPDALDLDELATIVAVGRAPTAYSPIRHPERLEAIKKELLTTYNAR